MEGIEWVVILVIIAVLLMFGPDKIPKLANSIGRAWGEVRKSRLEIETELNDLRDGHG